MIEDAKVRQSARQPHRIRSHAGSGTLSPPAAGRTCCSCQCSVIVAPVTAPAAPLVAGWRPWPPRQSRQRGGYSRC